MNIRMTNPCVDEKNGVLPFSSADSTEKGPGGDLKAIPEDPARAALARIRSALLRSVLVLALLLAAVPVLASPPAFVFRGGSLRGCRIGAVPGGQAQLRHDSDSAVASACVEPGLSCPALDSCQGHPVAAAVDLSATATSAASSAIVVHALAPRPVTTPLPDACRAREAWGIPPRCELGLPGEVDRERPRHPKPGWVDPMRQLKRLSAPVSLFSPKRTCLTD